MLMKLFCPFLFLLFFHMSNGQQPTYQNRFSEKWYGGISSNLPDDLSIFLEKHIKEFKIPGIHELDSDMLNLYYEKKNVSEHPAVYSVDFNLDGVTDYAPILKSWRGVPFWSSAGAPQIKLFSSSLFWKLKGIRVII